MDIHSWRSAVPTPTKVFNLADSSDSDGELPSLPITAAAARKNINDAPGPSQSASSSSAAAAPGTAPVLVPPRAAPVNSMFIGSKQREHPLPANARKTVPSHQSPTTFFTANQYRQPREAVVIDDSPPPKQHNSLKDALPQSPSHSKRFLSPARQPLTEISSSSSTDSVVLVNTVAPKASTSSSSWNNHVRKPSYEPYSDNKPTSTPRKTVDDGYSSHIPAKARIMASFNLPKQQHHLAPATPIGKPRDPTMYSSHSAYKPSTSEYSTNLID